MEKAHSVGMLIFVWLELYLVYGMGHGFGLTEIFATMFAMLIAPALGIAHYEDQ